MTGVQTCALPICQATSRRKQLEKIKLEEIKPSSRQNPYIRFEQLKKLYRGAVSIDKLSFTYPGAETPVLKNISFNVEAGDRIAIIGPNGIGKTTLMQCLAGVYKPTSGEIEWVENAQPGYMPQDPQAEFAERIDLFAWMSNWTGKADDDQLVRGTLGRLLFSGDETKKPVTVLSGGPKADWTKPVSEDDLLTLERSEFMKLLHNEGTLARIEHMLDKGKPLRN